MGIVHLCLVVWFIAGVLFHTFYIPYLVNTWAIRAGVGVLAVVSALLGVLALRASKQPKCPRNFLIYMHLNVSIGHSRYG